MIVAKWIKKKSKIEVVGFTEYFDEKKNKRYWLPGLISIRTDRILFFCFIYFIFYFLPIIHKTKGRILLATV